MEYIKYGKTNLCLILASYKNNGNLYVGLKTKSGEDYSDLTINIPMYMFETDNEIIINNDNSNELIETLEDLNILTDTFKYAYSGYARYKVMNFNKEVAKKYIKKDYREEN